VKEIKAFIRQHRIANVLQALRDLKAADISYHNITVSQVQRPLVSEDPAQQHYAMDLAEAVVSEYKLDLVCTDEVADELIGAITTAAHTGLPDAGWIFVSEVTTAIEIR
jgi:nitrogen regulatory protein P-II 1